MNKNDRDYVLGVNVTEQAKAQESRGTVVVSFRVSDKDFKRLSTLADSEGKRVSQVAREALLLGLNTSVELPQSSASISLGDGAMVSWGNAYIGTSGANVEDPAILSG